MQSVSHCPGLPVFHLDIFQPSGLPGTRDGFKKKKNRMACQSVPFFEICNDRAGQGGITMGMAPPRRPRSCPLSTMPPRSTWADFTVLKNDDTLGLLQRYLAAWHYAVRFANPPPQKKNHHKTLTIPLCISDETTLTRPPPHTLYNTCRKEELERVRPAISTATRYR